ncbi:hypothetical protein Ocin01_08951, partial [Orchesella cincta]
MVSVHKLHILLMGMLVFRHGAEGQTSNNATNITILWVDLPQNLHSNRVAGNILRTECPQGQRYSNILKLCIASNTISDGNIFG